MENKWRNITNKIIIEMHIYIKRYISFVERLKGEPPKVFNVLGIRDVNAVLIIKPIRP